MKAEKLNSIEKALEILLCFTPYNRELGTGEIGQRLGLHKATASRILRTLVERGFLQQDPETKKFSLGPALADLARAYNHSLGLNLVHLAKKSIDDLRDELGETVVLEIMSGSSTVIAYVAEGPQKVRIAGTVGDRLPVHAAAGAKAILAFSSPDLVDRLINGRLPALTPNTITDPAAYRRQLARIRRQGYSVDREEIDVGINAVGAPVFDYLDRPVAAVVVAGPAQRITGASDSAVVRKVRETASRISQRLHHRVDAAPILSAGKGTES